MTLNATLRWSALVVLLACVPALSAERPNFVFINIDDLGYADVGCYGSKINKTPNIDRMAAEGMKLTSFYAAPVCSPSRASLMTGSYPKRCLPIPHVLFPGDAVGLNPSEVTIAELLKQQGYATGIIGKWHLGDQTDFLPTRQGFDFFYGLPYSNDMGPAADGVKSDLGKPLPGAATRPAQGKNAQGKQPPTKAAPAKPAQAKTAPGQPPLPWLRNETVIKRVLPDDQQSMVEMYTKEAVAFLKQHKDESFFLYLPHNSVHFPIYPGKKWAGKNPNGLYSDWVEETDWSVGQVLDTLRELGLDKKTLVVFTSDNGGTQRASNTPLRGFKASTWEGGVRVPTIAWWPGKIAAGTTFDGISGMIDILPTFVPLAGGQLPTDRKYDGGDLWPVLSGQPGAKGPRDTFYYYRGLKLEAVRKGTWKLHLAKGELYNLATDVSEAHDVAKDNEKVVEELKAMAQAMDGDLGLDGFGAGVRKLGKVDNARPIIAHDGTVRSDLKSELAPVK
ncbi:sulfatase family protein [Humisphaera borealis]|uniref:Sulfatase n=1 Tax=Humisphaera borealis TaxID=2807512 RepID=A0A7M2X0D0_9BACT|nr:sulfatase [Humisphaera borealis]QOV91114.1 sulfatase [Humisphaera borealis]